MPKQIPDEKLRAIEAVVVAYPEGVGLQGIRDELGEQIPARTLQYRLKQLVDAGRLATEGRGRWRKYKVPALGAERATTVSTSGKNFETETKVPVSRDGAEIWKYVCQPVGARKPVGYDRKFLDAYRPNVSAYLTEKERAHLAVVGTPEAGIQPAGTYAKHVLNRLLIDLSWNSSRLEGNTYSLLDTRRLIHFGEEASGKARVEAQMILNHKDAIEFLVSSAGDIGFNRPTILNLHAILAKNLLANPESPGRLRRIAVGIEKSSFHPLEVPQLVEECFDQILATADAIRDPFEQSFFVLAQLPYLQPFDDVNKRVSRLAANIPFFIANLTPLSFTDVSTRTYTEAILGVYELNKVDLLKDVFIWAYERSALRCVAVRQSIGEPDPFRLKHQSLLGEIVSDIVLGRMSRQDSFAHIRAMSGKNVEAADREQFRVLTENEVLGLHEGNFARYRIRLAEFQAWQQVWRNPAGYN